MNAFTAQQGTDLARLGAAVGRFQNAALVGIGELSASGARHDLCGDARTAAGGADPVVSSVALRAPLRDARIGRIVQNLHHDALRLMVVGHTYLVAH